MMRKVSVLVGLGLSLVAKSAMADYATPPPGAPSDPIEVAPSYPPYSSPPDGDTNSDYERFCHRDGRNCLERSGSRFELGPAMLSTGAGVGYGVGAGLAFGENALGFRIGAAFYKGEESTSTVASTGDFMQTYTMETTLDLNKEGRLHPIVAMGLVAGHVHHANDLSGWYGAGTARASLEYAFNLDHRDVRFGVGVTGAMVGPRADDIKNLGGYAVVDAKWVIGF